MSANTSSMTTADVGQPLAVSWTNVAFGGSLLLLDIVVCIYFQLGFAQDLIVAAIRCVVQLSLLALILDSVFEAKSPWAVAGLGLAMLLLGANEVTFIRSKKRTDGLFLSSIVAFLASVAPVTLIASKFIIGKSPFWTPDSFIPILGMLTGNCISGSAVAVNFITKEIEVNRDKIETLLSHGASRTEAVLPLARDALKLALLPAINTMSVVGLVAIPGMMTGAILGGADVAQAARMQMAIMFIITACTTLCVCCAVFFALRILVDNQHRIRADRISTKRPWPAVVYSKSKSQLSRAVRAFGNLLRRDNRSIRI